MLSDLILCIYYFFKIQKSAISLWKFVPFNFVKTISVWGEDIFERREQRSWCLSLIMSAGQESCIDDCQIASRKIMGARPTPCSRSGPKSFYISPAVRCFYQIGSDIWVGFGPAVISYRFYKGQTISKAIYGVLNSPKKRTLV